MEKNVAYWSEYSKLGLNLPRNHGYLYGKLESPGNKMMTAEGEFFPSSPLYCIRFCNAINHADWLAVANEDGTVCVHDTGANRMVKIFQAHYNAIFDLAWLENDVKLVTSSGDHSALLWDLGRGVAVPVVRMVGHQGSVKAVACKPGDPCVFTTGARDGVIMQWDIRTNHCRSNVSDEEGFRSVKADKIIKFSHRKNSFLNRQRNVEKALESSLCISSVVYQDPLSIISCSSTDKTIKVWDTRKTYSAFKGIPTPMHSITRESHSTTRTGYTSLAVSPCRLRLYAYCTDANLYSFNIGTYSSEPMAVYKGPGSSSFFCKINVSPDGRFISSGSSDGKGYVWSVASPEQHLVALEGHLAEVTCVDWCKFGQLKLASCSDDGTFRVWKVNTDISAHDSEEATATRITATQPIDTDVIWKAPRPRKYFAPHGVNLKKWRCPSSDSLAPTRSPKKLCVTPKKVEKFLTELPNYVVDGISPHQPPPRVAPSPAADSDWLRRLMGATPPPAKTSAKKSRRTPNHTTKPSVRGNLLKYFKKSDEPTNVLSTKSVDGSV